MTAENQDQTPSETRAPRFTPAPSFTGRNQSVTPRPQTAERLDSLRTSAESVGQKATQRVNDLVERTRSQDSTVGRTARSVLDSARTWGEKGLRAVASSSEKAADYLRSLEGQQRAGQAEAPAQVTTGKTPTTGTPQTPQH